jgi:WD40 repeat protein
MTISLIQSIPFTHKFNRKNEPARVSQVALSPDGLRLAAASYFELAVHDVGDPTARWRVVDLPNTRTVHTSALAWSPDGAHVLAAHNGTLVRYDAASGEVLARHVMPINGIAQIVWSPDHTRYLAPHRLLYVCDAATGAEIMRIDGPTAFMHVGFTADGSRILAIGDKSLWVFDAASGALLHRYPYARFGVHGLANAPDGSYAWVTEAGDAAVCLQIGKKTKKVLAKIEGPGVAAGGRAAMWRDGSSFILASALGISAHRAADGATLAHLPSWEDAYCDALHVAPQADRFATGHVDGTARVWSFNPQGSAP